MVALVLRLCHGIIGSALQEGALRRLGALECAQTRIDIVGKADCSRGQKNGSDRIGSNRMGWDGIGSVQKRTVGAAAAKGRGRPVYQNVVEWRA